MENMENIIFIAKNWKIIPNFKKEFNENGSQGLWEVPKTPMMTSLDLCESPASAGLHCHGSSVRRNLLSLDFVEVHQKEASSGQKTQNCQAVLSVN